MHSKSVRNLKKFCACVTLFISFFPFRLFLEPCWSCDFLKFYTAFYPIDIYNIVASIKLLTSPIIIPYIIDMPNKKCDWSREVTWAETNFLG